jgi:purine nucleosidase
MTDAFSAPTGSGRKLPVLFIHDAALDDYVATMLLVAMPQVELKGIVIANADCVPGPGISGASRLQQFIGRPDIPLALSEACGWNPFPWSYREECISFDELPILAPYRSTVPTPPPSGNQLIARLLEEAVSTGNRLIVLLTTGFTPLTNVLKAKPELAAGVGRVVWMGGAIDVPGNLDPTTIPPVIANKHAEWNVFWDPFAAQDALNLFSGICDFPLDITNSVPISKELLARLKLQGQKYSFSQLAYETYALVADAAYYDMWDTCTAVFLARPDLYAPPEAMKLGVVQWGYEQGWLHRSKEAQNSQFVFKNFANLPGFYDYVAAQLARSSV